ncbi:golvesin C-terminal-like domain-containing protein [Streptomyces zaomyceticus]|uniref:golvesin C-terminal-like domain-containing protein n=1 Tax=Streptomyces zaomyceticus TaxID=68286 RepID=UPI0016734548|nr:GDSL-type esterase/lipase family protein [Streptomyces zaomyceticus]GHG06296.1 hypothetical protein GCM10018791_18420 [Streptomyces zaomyceticus]
MLALGLLLEAGTPNATALPVPPRLDTSPGAAADARQAPTDPPPDRVREPDRDLAPGWRTAEDRAVTLVGDAAGLHVLTARSDEAYRWREAAVLRREGLETDRWIGNLCVTGSGTRAFVTYAPREFTNTEALSEAGGFAAVVDLDKGTVRHLPFTSSLDYYSPGCGTGESAVFTQAGFTRAGKTRLVTVDGATGRVTGRATVDGQITSAVPTAEGIVAARAGELVRFPARGGRATALAKTDGSAFRLVPDAQQGVQFLQADGDRVRAVRWRDGRVAELARGRLGELSLVRGAAGRVFLTGTPTATARTLPASTRRVTSAAGEELSTRGRLAITSALPGPPPGKAAESTSGGAPDPAPDEPLPARITARDTTTGRTLEFTVPVGGGTDGAPPLAAPPAASTGAAPKSSPTAPATGTAPKTTPPGPTPYGPAGGDVEHSPVDSGGRCAVVRNDVGTQVYQPTPNQLEWAVDLAVRNLLNNTNALRLSGWKQAGLDAPWSPQGLFPSLPLAGAAAGKRVPAQIMLGILAQESNMWQASKHTLPGQYGNPLIGNYYGLPLYDADPNNDWDINWTDPKKADCGYGVGQVTDGMRADSPVHTAFQKRAITMDYATNVARSLQILQGKWNELHNLPTPMKVNDDDPMRLENWYLALWNYNLGFNAPGATEGTDKWGMGWLNNPANPKYPADRRPFLDNNHYADAARPQNWPYQEKVLGWAAWPIDTGRSYNDSGVQDNGNTHGYQAAWWSTAGDRSTLIAPRLALCSPSVNNCDPDAVPDCPDEACYRQLWWTGSISWKDCSISCGNETMTYKTKLTEPGDGQVKIAPACGTAGLPAGARIVDDVPTGSPVYNCTRNWTSSGEFTFTFERDPAINAFPARIDLHQLGNTGFGSHTWFSHTREKGTQKAERLNITGTWRLDAPTDAWTRIMVHMPSSAAFTQQARYEVDLPDGRTKERVVPTRHRANTWVNLGVFDLRGDFAPTVRLSTRTKDGTGDDDIAWDAMAFVPLPGKPKDFVVSLGDSYASGEGAEDYTVVSDNNYGNRDWNACHRSRHAWPRKMSLPGTATPVGQRADAADPSLDFAFLACSGARSTELLTDDAGGYWTRDGWKFDAAAPEGQFREVAQLNSGFLDENTTLVTLSVGGNDAGFADVLRTCATTKCPSSESVQAGIEKAFCDTLSTSCAQAGPASVIRAIHAKARNAVIVLVGYPHVVKPTADSCRKVFLSDFDITTLSEGANYMAMSHFSVATYLRDEERIPVAFVDVRSAFEGHRLCESDEWLNGIVLAPQSEGDFDSGAACIDPRVVDPFCVSRESFHPLKAGTTGYAQAVTTGLADIF